MKKFLFPLLLVVAVSSAFTVLQTKIARSAITFKIKNLGISTGGSIEGLQADINFNPADLATSSIQASVEVATINTDNSTRDEHLKSDSFFDVTQYPKISLKSVSFKHKSGDNYSGVFNLTIKNKTKAIEFPFSYTDKGANAVFIGSFKINRRDYGVGESSLTLSDDVTISIDAEIVK